MFKSSDIYLKYQFDKEKPNKGSFLTSGILPFVCVEACCETYHIPPLKVKKTTIM